MQGSIPQIPGIKAPDYLAREFRHEVAGLLNRTNINFPGAQPISFTRQHLESLCKEDYFLCEKTDGIRCLLYCTLDESSNEIHYLIDRRNDYYYIAGLHFPHQSDPSFKRPHTNTLLDGELVLDTFRDGRTQLRYMVFDCILLDGELLTQKTFDKRIGRFHEFVQKPLKRFGERFPDARKAFPFEVMFKHMEKPYAVEDMFNTTLPNLFHGNDGLVFTAKNAHYVSGTDEKILKWKPAHENSIDFKLMLGEFPLYDPLDGESGMVEDWDAKPTFGLLVNFGSGDYRHFADLYVSDEDWESMKSLNQVLDGRIIECYCDSQSRWRFKREPDGRPRFREDKPDANHISTVTKVIESIQDAVTQEELVKAADTIWRAWKERHPEERSGSTHNGHA